ncbi:MAG: hypothetical protein N2663_04480 [Chlorobi bacterium]|nr:hypothetical protein [Chlorobiota bacterium]
MLTAIILAVFVLYAQSLLVMWCLYFVEKHDIVLYFCPDELGSTSPFAGARFVHELSDAQRGKADGVLVLISIVERSLAYAPARQLLLMSARAVQWLPLQDCVLAPCDGYDRTPFIPPRFSR